MEEHPARMGAWALVAVFGLAFVAVRSALRWRVGRGALSLLFHDTWFHLLYAEEIAANGHRVPRRIRPFLLSTHVAYPPLLHWALSFLPKRIRERTEPFWGGLLDALAGMALLALAAHLPGGTLATGAWAAGLLLATPALQGTGWGPRALHGTPRVLGQLLFALAIFAFLLHRQTGAPGWFAAAAAAGSLIFVASFFSVQAFAFANLIAAALLRSWEPLALLGASFALSLLWFRGYALHLLRSQFRMLAAMRRALRRGEFDCAAIQARNRWRDFLRLPGYLRTDPRRAQELASRRNTWLILLLQMPLVPACFCVGGPTGGFATGCLHDAGAYVWAGLALFALTSLRPFLFLGEAERYAEHVLPLLCLTMAFALPAAPPGLGAALPVGVLAVSVAVGVWNARGFLRQERAGRARQDQVRETLEWIRRQAAGRRFAVLPRGSLNLLIPYLAGGSVLYGQWASHSPPDVQALRNPESAEFARCRDGLFERFGIDYVVLDVRRRERPGFRDMFAAYPEAFGNAAFSVRAFRPPAAGHGSPAG